MLKEFVKSSRAKSKEVAEHMEMLPPALNRVLNCEVYMANNYYDKLYNYIESTGGVTPRRDGFVCYPSQKAAGTWDVYVDDKFAVTMPFINHRDLFEFLNGQDLRYHLVKNIVAQQEETTFKNKVIVAGKRREGRDF